MKSNSKTTKLDEAKKTATFLVGPLMLSCDFSFMFVDKPYSNERHFFIIKENCDFEVGYLLIETIIYLEYG